MVAFQFKNGVYFRPFLLHLFLICFFFLNAVWNETKLMDSNVKSEEDQGKLGVLGLSTLYANVVNMIDGLVSFSLTSS